MYQLIYTSVMVALVCALGSLLERYHRPLIVPILATVVATAVLITLGALESLPVLHISLASLVPSCIAIGVTLALGSKEKSDWLDGVSQAMNAIRNTLNHSTDVIETQRDLTVSLLESMTDEPLKDWYLCGMIDANRNVRRAVPPEHYETYLDGFNNGSFDNVTY